MKFNISKTALYKKELREVINLSEVRKESLKYKFVNVKYNKQSAVKKKLKLAENIIIKMFGL